MRFASKTFSAGEIWKPFVEWRVMAIRHFLQFGGFG